MTLTSSAVIGRDREYFKRKYDPRFGNYLQIHQTALTRLHHSTAVMLLRSVLGSTTPDTVADIGCAVCDFTARLQQVFPGAKFIGMDFVREGLEEANRRYPGIHLIEAALPGIPLKTGSLGLVVCMEVLYYLDHATRAQAVNELARVVAQDGLVLVGTNLDGGRNYFSEEQLLDLFHPHFEIRALAYEHCRLYRLFAFCCKKSRQLLLRARAAGAPMRIIAALLARIEGSMTLARAGTAIGRILLGRRAITNGVYVFGRAAHGPNPSEPVSGEVAAWPAAL